MVNYAKKSQIVHVRHHQNKETKHQCPAVAGADVCGVLQTSRIPHTSAQHNITVETYLLVTEEPLRVLLQCSRNWEIWVWKLIRYCMTQILSIENYARGVWVFQEYSNCRVLQNKVIRFFLGTHTFTTLAALYTEMECNDVIHTRWIDAEVEKQHQHSEISQMAKAHLAVG